MRVIPVIDIKRGQVVRGVGGRRDQYRPIVSRLCENAEPETVAQAFVAHGFCEAYVADLDAIEGIGNADAPLHIQIRQDLQLMVDAGLRDAETARRLINASFDGRPLAGIVAGLESLDSPQVLAEICRVVEPERLIFSLDLKTGRPLTNSDAWRKLTPLEIAQVVLRFGVRRMIVLDLARVGMDGGVGTEPLCRQLRCLAPELEIIAGGGVRSAADLDSLARAGCDAALVASALHDGRLDPATCAGRTRQHAANERRYQSLP